MAQRPQEAPYRPDMDGLTTENRWKLEVVDL